MRVELFNYGRCRYMLCGPSDLSPRERYETELDALAAGAILFADRNERHWAAQPEVVARIRTFIKASIPWHLSGMWEDNPREVVTCLCRCVLDGSVVVLRAEPAYITHSGFVPTRQYYYAAYEKDIAERASSYAARSKAHRNDLKAYNQAIDERAARAASALKPFRHIETIAEAGARNRAARAASGGLAVLASSVGAVVSAVASSFPSFNDAAEDEGFLNLGDVTELRAGSTPLGDAAPFEYIKNATGEDALSVAARGVSEAIETQCMAEYERALDMCGAVAYPMGLSRGMALCRANAFDRYQQCRVTNGFEPSKAVHHHRFFSGRCAAFGLSGGARKDATHRC